MKCMVGRECSALPSKACVRMSDEETNENTKCHSELVDSCRVQTSDPSLHAWSSMVI
jgi:hypothetical protein